jgi:hypothetical protein
LLYIIYQEDRDERRYPCRQQGSAFRHLEKHRDILVLGGRSSPTTDHAHRKPPRRQRAGS